MTGYFTELSYVLLTYAAGYAIQIYPMWKTRDMKARTVFAVLACLTALQGVGLFIARHHWEMDITTINTYIAAVGLPTSAIFPFFIYRKRAWQNIFLLSICLAYHLSPGGISNYAYDTVFASYAHPLFAANALKIAITVITLPLVLYVLRRLFSSPYIGKAVVFWRFFWLIPGLFFSIIMMSNNYLFFIFDNNISFVVVRLLALAALLLTCYLFEVSLRQTVEAQSAKHKAEEQTAKADFYRRMSHDLRTPLTRVSTSIQVVKDHPEMADELLTDAQADIMGMANMISSALDDGEGVARHE